MKKSILILTAFFVFGCEDQSSFENTELQEVIKQTRRLHDINGYSNAINEIVNENNIEDLQLLFWLKRKNDSIGRAADLIAAE